MTPVTIVGICASPKKTGSTTMFALEKTLAACRAEGAETRIISLAEYTFGGCHDCDYCRHKLGCSQKDDFTEHLIPQLTGSDIGGIIYASPVYFGGVNAQMKTFMDRCVPFRRNGYLFADKVAGALTVGRSRNGGQELAAMDIVKNCMIQGMTIVPDATPTSHFGANLWSGNLQGIEEDEIGLATAVNLGKRVAQIAIKLRS